MGKKCFRSLICSNIYISTTSVMMASSYSIETPVTLLALPGPVSGIRAGPVQSISGSRKRKRVEVVLGSDGQSVNIYDVRNSGSYICIHITDPYNR